MKILALDPGGTSGIATWTDGVFDSWESAPLDALRHIEAGDLDGVACESWIPRPGIRTFQPEALESIGAARYLCWRQGIPFKLQSPAEAKRFATNEKLAKLGWRKPSPGGHRDDAARHLLVITVRLGLVDAAQFVV